MEFSQSQRSKSKFASGAKVIRIADYAIWQANIVDTW